MLLIIFHLIYFIQYVDMKNFASGTVHVAPAGKDECPCADEWDQKALLRTDLLALRELAANMSNGIIW